MPGELSSKTQETNDGMVEMCIPGEEKNMDKGIKRWRHRPILLNYSLKLWVKEYTKDYELYPHSVGS